MEQQENFMKEMMMDMEMLKRGQWDTQGVRRWKVNYIKMVNEIGKQVNSKSNSYEP